MQCQCYIYIKHERSTLYNQGTALLCLLQEILKEEYKLICSECNKS